MKYEEVLEYTESLQKIGIVPGLDSITALCRKLGNPQDKLSFVHIAGTNAKGSCLAYVSTVLKENGYRVGRYLSPVISDYREKMQVNAVSVSKADLCDCMEKVRAACEEMKAEGLPQPSAFEVETAAAFLFFVKKKCEIVVLEAGMGGREDATNLIRTTAVSVLTPIGMDHMQYLGNTAAEIAGQKAGIIKEGVPVVSFGQDEEVLAVISKEAAAKNSALYVAAEPKKVRYGLEKQSFSYTDHTGKKWEKLEISLAGICQISNAAAAVEVLSVLGERGFPVSEKALRKGLMQTRWPVRFEVVSKRPYVILDGAHNEDAAKKLAASIRFYFTKKRIIYIMGMLRDKEYEKVIAETYSYAEQIITITAPDNPRALPALELAKAASGYHPAVTAAGSVEEALEMALLLADREDVILCFGSLSYLGRMKKQIQKLEKGKKKRGQRKN